MMTEKQPMELDERIDAVESAYEFMLAYAAQGRQTDQGGGAASDLRDYLRKMEAALEGLGQAVAERLGESGGAPVDSFRPFLDAASQDAARALAIIRLVLAKPAISSQLIDNVNASIHLRALLTDLFIVDESLKQKA
jgi:alkylation response protein AidB-like acyl-CoA dehydrogenase